MEFRGRGQSDKPQHRINEQIRAASVRVVGENVETGGLSRERGFSDG